MPSKRLVRSQTKLAIKRIYEPPSAEDGARIMVDRIWPRGVSKSEAHIDVWLKELAPSGELRKWFGHEETRWAEFCSRYSRELDQKAEIVQLIQEKLAAQNVTLLYAAANQQHNNARCLADYLVASKRPDGETLG